MKIPFGATHLPLLLFLLSSCQRTNQGDVPVYLSTPLTGPKHKGQALLDSAQLFAHLHPELHLKIQPVDSRSEPRRSAEQLLSFLKQPDPKLIFAPPGTDPSQAFLDLTQGASREEREKTFFLNQVTASTAMNSRWPTFGTFFSTSDYLRGVVDLLRQREKIPGRAHILRLGTVQYFDEVAAKLRLDLSRYAIPIGLDHKIIPHHAEELLTAWKKAHVQKGDWVFLLAYGEPETFGVLKDEESFAKAVKVLTYGDQDFSFRKAPWFYGNSWQALFWHPAIRFKGTGSISTCDFVRTFEERYQYRPDFHAAYMFSTLEATASLGLANPFGQEGILPRFPVATVTGDVQWSPDGSRVRNLPILLHDDDQGAVSLYLPPQADAPCAPASPALAGVSIRHWAPAENSLAERPGPAWASATKNGSRFIPLELWTGAPWNGNRDFAPSPADKTFGPQGNKEILGPFSWRHPKLGAEIQVYKRTHRTDRKVQLFALREDHAGIGRVYDSREGKYYAWEEAKFPLGTWKQGETRAYTHRRWRFGAESAEVYHSRLHVLNLDYEFRSVPHSLRYELVIANPEGKIVSHHIYVYSPGLGNVAVEDLLEEKRADD